ncbi:MAG TPA: glycosyltransferase family 2 protein [Rhizomicrobium sp.]
MSAIRQQKDSRDGGPAVTAVICTYDRYDLLTGAIDSLTRQTLPADQLEILVVDNSPDHAHSQKVSKNFAGIPNLKWLMETRPGLSNARNVAIREARAPIVAFMDDDAAAEPTWLEWLLKAFQRFGDDAVAAGGRVKPIWAVDRPAWLHEKLLGYVSVVDWGGITRFAAPQEWVAGTNIAFRVEPLRKVGGFSVHLGRNRGGHALLSNDETEVVEKLTAAGGRLLYVPEAIVNHLVPPERLTQAWFRRRVAWQAVSEYLQRPAELFDRAPAFWNDVTDFYAHLPPKLRTPRGLWAEQRDAELFQRQMSAIYNFTVASLAGFHSLEGD